MADKTMGERVRAMRATRGMTQVQLSAKSGLGQSAISSLENDKSRWVMSPNLLKLAAALGVNPHWLETGRGDPARPESTTPDEAMAVELFRNLSPSNRSAWIAAGMGMLDRQPPAKASKTQPFPVRKP